MMEKLFSTPPKNPPSDLLTANECAELFRVTPRNFRERARLGVYPAPVKVGVRSLRWRKDDILEFLSAGGING